MLACHECGKETWDLHYCSGQGCDHQLCEDCGPLCSRCAEIQETLRRAEEEKRRFKPGETLKTVEKAVAKATGKALEKGFITGYKLWNKAVGTTLMGVGLWNRFSRDMTGGVGDVGGTGTDGFETEEPEEPETVEGSEEISSDGEVTAEETTAKMIEASKWRFDDIEEEETEDDTEED